MNKNRNGLTPGATFKNTPTLVICGMGGSGTRIVSAIAQACDVFLEGHNNKELNNLDFAFTFSARRKLFDQFFPFDNIDCIIDDLKLFEKLFFRQHLTFNDLRSICRIVLDFLLEQKSNQIFRTHNISKRLKQGIKLFNKKVSSHQAPNKAKSVGFKTISLISLPALLHFIPHMKLIHVIRDGRDMALSSNQKYYYFSSTLFNLPDEYTPENAFMYWHEANKLVNYYSTKFLTDKNCLIVKYEDICNNPKPTIDRVASFLNYDLPPDHPIYDLPQNRKNIGRWHNNKEQLQEYPLDTLKLFDYV